MKRLLRTGRLIRKILDTYFENDNTYITEKTFKGLYGKYNIRYDQSSNIAIFSKNHQKKLISNYKYKRKTIKDIEWGYLNLIYQLKRTLSVWKRQKLLFEFFCRIEEDAVEWIIYLLTGQWSYETGITKSMYKKIKKEVLKMKEEGEKLFTVSIMNKNSGFTIGRDFILSPEVVNSILRTKTHKEFTKQLNEVIQHICKKPSVINKIIYGD